MTFANLHLTWRHMMKNKTVGLVQVKLDLETYKRLKIYCVETQSKLKDVVEKAIVEHLNKETADERS